jgi:hypothetical protein
MRAFSMISAPASAASQRQAPARAKAKKQPLV